LQPTPLQKENTTYYFIYPVNSTHNGIGKKELEVIATDWFGNIAEYNETVINRILSYNGIPEEESNVQDNIRKSILLKEDKTNIISLQIGLIGFFIILVASGVLLKN
jgi:hypothetical protein